MGHLLCWYSKLDSGSWQSGLQIRVHDSMTEDKFYHFSTKTYVVGTQKNFLDYCLYFSTQYMLWVLKKSSPGDVIEHQKHMFKLVGKKIIAILGLDYLHTRTYADCLSVY